MPARLAVLISGNGSNLQAILDAIRMRVLDAQVVVVVSNRKAAYGLERAAKAGVPTLYHPLKPYRDAERSRNEYDADLAQMLGCSTNCIRMAEEDGHLLRRPKTARSRNSFSRPRTICR